MTIERIYKSRITSNFLTDMLKSGRIPTINELSAFVDNITLDTLPLLKNRITPYRGAASAEQFSGDIEALNIDVESVYDYITEIAKNNNSLSNFVVGKLLMYKKELQSIMEDVEALLLVSPDTAGFNDYYYEPFDDVNNIDFAVSNGYVDKQHSLYRQGVSNEEALVNIMKSNIKVSFGEIPNVISSNDRSGFELVNLIDRTPRQWQREVVLSAPSPVTAHIYIDFSRTISGINRIDIDYTSSTGDEAVSMSYTNGDGIYTNINIGSMYVVLGSSGGSFNIQEINEAKGIRIDVLKNKYDYVDANGNYVYILSLDEISIYADGKKTSDVTVYQSDPVSIVDNFGNNKLIKACSLFACDNIPVGTRIDYMVFGYDSNNPPLEITQNDFINISNTNSINQTFTTVVRLGSVDKAFAASVEASIVGEWSTNVENKVFDYDISSLPKEDIYVWVNPLQYKVPPFDTGTTGWNIDGGTYSCVFYVDEDAGITIDLKTTIAIINNKQQTGKVFLSRGVHTFSTLSNWKNNVQASDFSSNTEPVPNHKYLIEGVMDRAIADEFGYQYRTTPRVLGAKKLSFVPKHDFLYGNLRVAEDSFTSVRESSDISKEWILLSDKSGNIDTILVEYNSENSFIDTMLVRAIMYSNDSGAAPSIDSILINLNTVIQ